MLLHSYEGVLFSNCEGHSWIYLYKLSRYSSLFGKLDLNSIFTTCKLQKQPPVVFHKKVVLKNLAAFSGKHLVKFFFNKVVWQHRAGIWKRRRQNPTHLPSKSLLRVIASENVTLFFSVNGNHTKLYNICYYISKLGVFKKFSSSYSNATVLRECF